MKLIEVGDGTNRPEDLVIRVIEGHDDVRGVLTAALVAMGFSVIPLATVDHDHQPVTASLVDVSLLRRAANWADAYLSMRGPVLFLLSTYEDEEWLKNQLGVMPSNVLVKPFAPSDLARRLGELIGWEPREPFDGVPQPVPAPALTPGGLSR